MEDNSVDAMCTDPPAGIEFMGKSFDDFRKSKLGVNDSGVRRNFVGFMTAVLSECYRVLKPGAHVLVWAIPRTSHWTATAVEDAGFEVRDVITHHFGSGFPKSLDVSKAIDKAAGAKREAVGPSGRHKGGGSSLYAQDEWTRENAAEMGMVETSPATQAAQEWSGFGTALKPASEHWILARKPLSEKNVAANVLKWGTGALNIDGCRVGTTKDTPASPSRGLDGQALSGSVDRSLRRETGQEGGHNPNQGRWPANLVLSHVPECVEVGTQRVVPGNGSGRTSPNAHGFRDQYVGGSKKDSDADLTGTYVDEDGKETVELWACVPGCPIRELDEQSGMLTSRPMPAGTTRKKSKGKGGYHDGFPDTATVHGYEGSKGGASRFFKTFDGERDYVGFRYVAKASRKERNLGLEALATEETKVANTHPTVKAVALMRYLCRLITPPGGVVLDPFMGSGSTGIGALKEGFGFIGIEQQEDYFAIAEARIATLAESRPRQGRLI